MLLAHRPPAEARKGSCESIAMHKIRVEVNDLMQNGYVYYRTEPIGKNFAPGFKPELTPKQMLALGVVGSTKRIRAAGSNGTAATTWAAAAPTMNVKSNAGGKSRGTSPR
jgi:hypothetical protein